MKKCKFSERMSFEQSKVSFLEVESLLPFCEWLFNAKAMTILFSLESQI